MWISSSFDSGNINCLAVENEPDSEKAVARLEINRDNNSDFFQWFHFRLSGAAGRLCELRIENAGEAAYPDGFEDYRAVASYDRETWFRIDTEFDGKTLVMQHKPLTDSIYFAYFAPYSHERYLDLNAQIAAAAVADFPVAVSRLGATVDGRDLDLLRFGEPAEDKPVFWIIARQHPGETMASWWIEGFVARLMDEADSVSRDLMRNAVFYVVPNMNPDGSYRGNLRTNATGANLNREWAEPGMERSPEVFLVREKMHETGVDFFLDVHGDEALPYNFTAGAEGTASWSDAHEARQDAFCNALKTACPDFQTEHGYERDAPGSANLAKATDYVSETFGCLALTLEMPFKDTADTPEPLEGWSPERCARLADGCISALYAVFDQLRLT